MARVQNDSDFLDEYPAHKSRPSLTTNASGIAESTLSYASMTTVEGLQRLSQFPAPPPGVPISPFEASLGIPSSPQHYQHQGGYMMTPPSTPPIHPVKPSVAAATLPAPPKVFSLPPRRQDSVSTASMNSSSTGRTTRPMPVPQVYSPASAPSPLRSPFTLPSASTSSPLSPHDWHDGSSSIGVDAYEERMLSTSFITSLLTSVDEQRPPPPVYKRDFYEPSVTSDMFSAESSVTYPPRMAMSPLHTDASIPSTTIPTAGRDTPSMHTVESVRYLQPSDRSLSITHSLQTVTSVTPLNQSFPHSETIEEETPATSPSTPVTPSRKRDRRQSMYSNKTAKSYVSSLITRISHSSGDRRSARQTAAHWFRRKPLPPVPRLPNMSLTQEVEYQQAEAALPLPDLVNRAQTLSRMLDKGHRPHSSNHPSSHTASRLASQAPSEDGDGVQVFGDEGAKMTGVAPRPGMFNATPQRRGRSQDYKDSQWNTLQDPPSPAHGKPPSKPLVFFRHHRLCVGMTVIFIIVIVIAVAVSVTLTRKNKANPRCPDNLAGATCSLNATCVCTTTTSGQCSNLAQNLVDLVPTLNSLFHSNFTPATLSKAVWLAQGNPGSSCASQAQIVDVAPALDQGISPNRTQWAQTALLWDFVQTSNLADVQTLQKFVLSAPWSKLAEFDGPTPDPSSSFTTRVSGFDFNFAAQTVTAPPATFVDAGQPSSAQINQVDGTARSALDRMYTFALASATQEQKALATYWSSVLQQKPSDLNAFLSQIRGSHILLPFDATATPGNQKVSAMLTNSTTAPFPPPLACYPGLSTAQLQAINAFESSVFGLPSAPATSKFDTACFPDRPIYGVLDVARLRLPFMDSRTGVAKQAAALRTQATEPASRAVVYNGEVFSALPGSSSLPSLTPAVLEPRRFGTMNHLEHVVLDYLQAIPDVNVAIALVQFVLSGPVAPPKSDSILFKSLSTLPVIEVAIFGTIDPFDIDSVVSSFSDPAGKLFFGTDQSLAVRDWAIGAVQSHVEWAELATSSGIVEDDTFTDPTFNQIWNSAFNFFHIPNDLNVGVGNITTGFCALHLLTGCP